MASAPPVTVRYAEPDYWEARYQREPALFEWFFGHTALRRILRTYVSKKKPILHVGCGTSNLQEGMARSGYNITNTDISEVVIKQMQQRHAQYTNMTYRISDCRCMPEFLDCSFGHVLDKGTMDALLCCKQGTENVMRMLLEFYRVLQPGGSFLLITLGDPTRRLPLLCDPRLPWKVSLLLLPKISAANQAYVDGKPINDSTAPVEAQGPFEVVDADTILDLPPGVQYSNFFFAYVCKKQPLQLPQHQGQKAQLPNGWVAGSKELFQKLQKELGLPEDLLDKGRRKRVMHVPAGQAHGSMHMLQQQHHHSSSNASATSGNSSPVFLGSSTHPGSCGGRSSSRSIAALAAPVGELQSALNALHLEQQLRSHQQHGGGDAAGEAGSNAHEQMHPDIPTRPQSAPNLVELADAAAAAEAAAKVAAAAAAATGSGGGSLLQQQQQPMSVDASRAAAAAAGASASAGASPVLASPSADPVEVGAAAVAAQAAAAAPGSSSHLLPPQHPAAAVGSGAAPQQHNASSSIALSADERLRVLVHSISGPAMLQPAHSSDEQAGGEQQEGEPFALAAAVAPQLMPAPAAQQQQQQQYPQVLNYAAAPACIGGTAAAAAPAGSSDAASPADGAAVLQASQLPPMCSSSSKGGKAGGGVSSTPTSPGTSSPSSHAISAASSSCQQPPLWPGLKLQQGQVLPQLQGQQALAVSAATAAATAAGMYPHPVAPRAARGPRLRRFSTEYGALSGSALQMQLELLRLQQAQHSESAADGLVLHDVAASDSCGGAAAAAAVAAAAWGTVRRPRDRRLSNLSILSGLSIMSSTSIDESGEGMVCEDEEACGSVAHTTGMCSSEPSCQLYSPGQGLSSLGPCDAGMGGGGQQQQQKEAAAGAGVSVASSPGRGAAAQPVPSLALPQQEKEQQQQPDEPQL